MKTPRLSPHDFEAVLSSYVAARRGEGLAEGTLVYRRLYLAHFLSWLKTEEVDAYRFEGTRFDCGTHLGLVDVAGAVDRLPRIGAAVEAQQARPVRRT